MNTRSMFLVVLAGILAFSSRLSADVYELRTYTTNEGKLENLNARFRDHTVELFRKHGMESVGYWVPADGPKSKNTLIYVLKHKSRESATASWKAFLSDPEWKKVAVESQKDGQILASRPESVFMSMTDYSPESTTEEEEEKEEKEEKEKKEKKEKKNGKDSDGGVFELRIYRCNEGKLKNLDARFRDHTMRIFDRCGMASVAYWHPIDKPASMDTLIYIIRHKSHESAKASWRAFGSDPEWRKVAEESQKDGRFLRERPEVVYMTATDYSAIR